MSAFFFIIFSGIVWMGLRGDIGVFTFAVGILLGFGMWRLVRFRSRRPFSIAGAIRLTFLGLSVFVIFIKELLLANLQQLRIVLAPRIQASQLMLIAAVVLILYQFSRGTSVFDCVVGFETIGLAVVGYLLLESNATTAHLYTDAALGLALFSVVGTIFLAYFLGRGEFPDE